jgi:mono/diheme cytochrome c family protein
MSAEKLKTVPGWAIAAAALVLFQAEIGRAEYNGDAFATCSACHLPDGVGVPGAFPPVRNRAARIAGLEGGRDYLITVLTYGLMGTITVDGQQYFGVMPGNGGPMSAEDIAAALNYVVFELNDNDATGIEPFTAEEVSETQAAVTLKSPAAAGAIRSTLAEKHGDQWP